MIYYAPKTEPTRELLQEYIDQGYYFRFQDMEYKLYYTSKSWGMIYRTAKEARADGTRVLNGKSCVKDPLELRRWQDSFSPTCHSVIVFKGEWTETGSDNEEVAKFKKLIDVFPMDKFLKLIHGMIKNEEEFENVW